MSEAIRLNLPYPVPPMNNDFAGNYPTADSSAALFEEVFKSHFKSLHLYAITIVRDEAVAEEMVQNVFFKLWERNRQIPDTISVTAYLFKAVYNESLNFLKHSKVKAGYRSHFIHSNKDYESITDPAVIRELQLKIDAAINELPEQCRTVFHLSRFEGRKYQHIAHNLGISVKTVENHMGKALRMLRSKLSDYLPALLILFINLKNGTL